MEHQKQSDQLGINTIFLSKNQKQFKMFDQNVGKHCAMDTCRQKDWLPVKCKYCYKVFCADHSSIQSHNCSSYQRQFKKVYICPLCNKTINVNSNLTVQENFGIHEAIDCSGNYQQIKHVLCPGTKCRTKLTELNTFSCPQCHHKVCLKHRMPEEHLCRVK